MTRWSAVDFVDMNSGDSLNTSRFARCMSLINDMGIELLTAGQAVGRICGQRVRNPAPRYKSRLIPVLCKRSTGAKPVAG